MQTPTAFILRTAVSSITINSDLTWSVFVHGHSVDNRSQILSAIPLNLDCESFRHILSILNKSTVCPGHPDRHFLDMVLSKKGESMTSKSGEVTASVDSNGPVQLNGKTYTQTVRCNSCEIIVGGSKCSKCVAYRSILRKTYHVTRPTRRTSTSSHTNFKFLNTPEKRERYRNLKTRSKAAERKLKDTIQKLTHQQGVDLEPEVHNELHRIMHEFGGKVRQKYLQGSFRYLFWEQQLQALQAKDCRQVRWHPALIKWCLHLKYKSSSAYHALRSSGV